MTFKSVLSRGVNCIPYSLRPWIKNVPGIAALQRWLIVRLLSERPFLHTINVGPATGLRFEIILPLDKPVWAGTYEPEFTHAIAQHVRPSDVCYDIGGYRGYMSGVMALAGAVRVFVFEPLSVNQKALLRLCELNPKLPINVITAALGNLDGSGLLKIMPDSSMGKLANSSFQVEARAIGETPVMVRQIDSLVQSREIPAPDLMKIDVEGGELDVLRGALRTLSVSRPKIFLEAHSGVLEKACSQQLSRLGYKIRRIEREIATEESTRHLVCLP